MITLCAVGDLMLGDSEKCIGYGSRSLIDKFGYDYPFELVAGKLKADFVFANLETVISDYGYDPLEMYSAQMRASPHTIKGVAKVFNVVNVANNHMMQHGEHCFNETVENLLKSNIGVVGLKGNGYFSSQPYIKRIANLNVGFLGYSFEKDVYCKKPLYAQGKEQEIVNDVNRLKLKADIVIVSCHWGDEFIERPSLNVIELSKKIIDNGASLILGHHPHVVQPIVKYNNAIIAYSLGNFVSDMAWDTKLLAGLVLKVSLEETCVNICQSFLSKNIALSQPVMVEGAMPTVNNGFDRKSTDVEVYENQYFIELRGLIRSNRVKTYLYFMRNFRKIKKKIFFQIIKKRLTIF